MRLAITIYSLLVAGFVACYCFVTLAWLDAKAVGPDAFPGSPDWSGTYFSQLEGYIWLRGVLVGLAIGAVSLLAFVRAGAVGPLASPYRFMLLASVLLPTIALVVGFLVGRGVDVPGRSAKVESCERQCLAEPTNAP